MTVEGMTTINTTIDAVADTGNCSPQQSVGQESQSSPISAEHCRSPHTIRSNHHIVRFIVWTCQV